MLKNSLFILLVVSICFQGKAQNLALETDFLKFEINTKGRLVSLYDKEGRKEYLLHNHDAPLISIRVARVFFAARGNACF